jgi:hypothetical protein
VVLSLLLCQVVAAVCVGAKSYAEIATSTAAKRVEKSQHQEYESKERLFLTLYSAFPLLMPRDEDPWRQHMLQAWAFARWMTKSLRLQQNRNALSGTVKKILRAEFGQDHELQEQGSESHGIGHQLSLSGNSLAGWAEAEFGCKRRNSDMSLPSPLRPPEGEYQMPPLYQRSKPAYSPPSPPDSDSSERSVSTLAHSSLCLHFFASDFWYFSCLLTKRFGHEQRKPTSPVCSIAGPKKQVKAASAFGQSPVVQNKTLGLWGTLRNLQSVAQSLVPAVTKDLTQTPW